MAIGYHNQYALQGGTTGLTMVPPASTAAGMFGVIYTANKNSIVDPTDPGDAWARLGSFQVGTGPDGVGTGLVRLTAWWKIFTGVQGSTAITLTGANRSLGGGMVYTKDPGETWATPTISSGSDITSGTAFLATMAANLGVTVGEFLLSVGVFTSIQALNGRDQGIPGMTFTSTGINSAGGATGNHIFIFTDHAQPSAGAQSGASTTIATAGGATTGGAINIRIGLAAGSNFTQTPTDAEGLTDTVTIDKTQTSSGDTEGLSDTATVALNKARTQTDTEGLTDSVQVALSGSQSVTPTDIQGLTDSAVLARSTGVLDAEGLTDTTTIEISASPLFTDSAGLTDQVSLTRDGITVVTDAAGLTDSVQIVRFGPGSRVIHTSGREPDQNLSGREPNTRLDGREAGAP